MRSFSLAVLVLFILMAGCKKDGGTGPGAGGGTITVNGFVKDLSGAALSGAAVLVPGKSAVTSGTDGSFSISDVTTPYDITFVVGGTPYSMTYMGLTRPDPTLHFLFQSFGPIRSATISGDVPSGGVTRVMFVSGNVSAFGTTTTNTFSFNVNWREGATTLVGTLHVLRWTAGPGGVPASYDAYGSRPLTITNGGTFPGNSFTAGQLTNPVDDNIGGSVVRPSTSYSLSQRDLYLGFENSLILLASEFGSLGENLSYTVPNIVGATFGIFARATLGSRSARYLRSGISVGSQGVTIPLAEAPQLSAPASGGTGVDTSTQFLFSQGGGTGVNFAQVVPAAGTDPFFFVVSAGNTFTIPNLSQVGLGLPSNRFYSWEVRRYFPFSSTDEAASPLLISRLSRNAGDFGEGRSELFNFTTR